MLVEDAINKVFIEGEAVFIPCVDKKHQESIRTTAFHIRQKMLKKFSTANTIGISKFSKDEQLFIKIYIRELDELFKLNKDGELVSVISGLSPEQQRIVNLMRKDGLSEEEIQENLKGGIV